MRRKSYAQSSTPKSPPGKMVSGRPRSRETAAGPTSYTIKMEGRQVGKVVMFKGSADLGPKDGGVYDWIGRMTDQEFVGFFTSAGYTGVFNLSKAKVSQ